MFENLKSAQSRNTQVAPPGVGNNTILNVVQIEHYAVQYVNGEGRIIVTTLVKVGGQWYEPKNAEPWTNDLRPVNEWMLKLLTAREASKAAVPTTDTVDVVSA